MTRHLRRLGNQFEISLPLDTEGYLGRECPQGDCERYFKIKPGTGLKGDSLPVHCPYCGHTGPMNDFHTRNQIEYAKSVVERQVHQAVVRDLEDMARDFNRRTRGELFSLNMDIKASPSRLRHYLESELETYVECGDCTLQYAVYGVFGFCPDCGTHNSLQILRKNLELVEKMLALATNAEKDVAARLVENALEDCVSAFDGFARELCHIHAKRARNPAKAERMSFQNLDGAKAAVKEAFGVDLSAALTAGEWNGAVRGFQKRHLVAHKMSVIDDDYLVKTGDPNAVVGRRIAIGEEDVRGTAKAVQQIATHFSGQLRARADTGEVEQ